MFKSKKGISGVITVVILVALALIAIGVVWATISNIITKNTQSTDLAAKCTPIEVRAISVDDSDDSAVTATLKRSAGGNDISGVYLVYTDGSQYSDRQEVTGNIEPLETKDSAAFNVGFDPNKIEVSVYLTDSEGNEYICQQSTEYGFD